MTNIHSPTSMQPQMNSVTTPPPLITAPLSATVPRTATTVHLETSAVPPPLVSSTTATPHLVNSLSVDRPSMVNILADVDHPWLKTPDVYEKRGSEEGETAIKRRRVRSVERRVRRDNQRRNQSEDGRLRSPGRMTWLQSTLVHSDEVNRLPVSGKDVERHQVSSSDLPMCQGGTAHKQSLQPDRREDKNCVNSVKSTGEVKSNNFNCLDNDWAQSENISRSDKRQSSSHHPIRTNRRRVIPNNKDISSNHSDCNGYDPDHATASFDETEPISSKLTRPGISQNGIDHALDRSSHAGHRVDTNIIGITSNHKSPPRSTTFSSHSSTPRRVEHSSKKQSFATPDAADRYAKIRPGLVASDHQASRSELADMKLPGIPDCDDSSSSSSRDGSVNRRGLCSAD